MNGREEDKHSVHNTASGWNYWDVIGQGILGNVLRHRTGGEVEYLRVLTYTVFLGITSIWFFIKPGEKQIEELRVFNITCWNTCFLITLMADQYMRTDLIVMTRFLAIEDGYFITKIRLSKPEVLWLLKLCRNFVSGQQRFVYQMKKYIHTYIHKLLDE